ncbi:GerAB/ArcD/ProY family transporter [Ectobacillus funiculus]|uniref:GerAB/ArcD/ProY family transporter n=1 Tax=Ectobacillus funiculus TaxID=137993 RepID=A0ABV5WHS2_9BACI
MNRYFYYLIIVNMIANIVASVPKILLESREKGAIVSMIFALITGTMVTYTIARFFNKFPGKGLPELLKEHTPKWIAIPFLMLLTVGWFSAGLTTLINYSFLLKRFLTPDMSIQWIVSIFLCFVSFGILMSSKSVLYTVEAVLVFNIPLVLLIMIKAYTGDGMEWDYVKESVMYIYHTPSYSAFSAALFPVIGAGNLIIFNRVFTKKQRMTLLQLGLIFLVLAGNLATTYLVPIGYIGFEHIDRIIYPWVRTSDAMRLEFGFIERVLFVFLVLYLAVSFLSILIHWHVVIELLKKVIWLKRFKWKERNLTPYLFVGVFWFISTQMASYLTEYQVTLYTSYFFNCMPAFLIATLLMLWFIKRRAKA